MIQIRDCSTLPYLGIHELSKHGLHSSCLQNTLRKMFSHINLQSLIKAYSVSLRKLNDRL